MTGGEAVDERAFWERALAKRVVDEKTGCWIWTGARDERGYGVIKDHGGGLLVHRIAAQFALGFRWMRGNRKTHVCHHCDNPACSNPEHLYVGNAVTNSVDRKLSKLLSIEGRQEHWRKRGRKTCEAFSAVLCEVLEEVGVGGRTGASRGLTDDPGAI